MSKNKIDLKKLRKNQRLTQGELCDILGVSRSIITKVEGNQTPLSKRMIQKLEEAFPGEFGLPTNNSGLYGNGTENDILIEKISVNLSNIGQVKFLLKEMCIKTPFVFNEALFFKGFITTSNRLKFEENLNTYENNISDQEYRFLIDFCSITKECLFSAYEDLFNFASVKYIYSDKEVQKRLIKEIENLDIDMENRSEIKTEFEINKNK